MKVANLGNYENRKIEISVNFSKPKKVGDVLSELEQIIDDINCTKDVDGYALRQARNYLSKPVDELEEWAIHYVFGVALGTVYGIVAEEIPAAGFGAGVPAGAWMWAATHGTTVPALGLQAPTREMPAAWYVWELGSHIVYGTTVELVRRAVRERI